MLHLNEKRLGAVDTVILSTFELIHFVPIFLLIRVAQKDSRN